MTGDEYVTLLEQRRDEWAAQQPQTRARPWLIPLLEWFVHPGDELLFSPPAKTRAPKKVTRPRVYRSAASLRAERDRLAPPTEGPTMPDTAAAGGEGAGTRALARHHARTDTALARHVRQRDRIAGLDARIRAAEQREATQTREDNQ